MSITHYPTIISNVSGSESGYPFYLEVAQGKIPGHSMLNKFGYNPSIGSLAFETIWETGDNYPWQTSAVTVDVVSDNTNDVNTTGSGARTLRIQGLDGSYNLAEETVNLNGTSTVTTSISSRVGSCAMRS